MTNSLRSYIIYSIFFRKRNKKCLICWIGRTHASGIMELKCKKSYWINFQRIQAQKIAICYSKVLSKKSPNLKHNTISGDKSQKIKKVLKNKSKKMTIDLLNWYLKINHIIKLLYKSSLCESASNDFPSFLFCFSTNAWPTMFLICH